MQVLSNVEGLPLDDGVRSLLQGCPLLTRFSVYLRKGGLTDRGVGYIGEFGAKLKWVLLGCSGESDEGLRLMADGCRQLERLELRGCPFGEEILTSSVLNMMTRLKYLWVQGVGATTGLGANVVVRKSGFLVEFVAERSQVLGYYTVTTPRTDNPPSVCLIYPTQEAEPPATHAAHAHVDFCSERCTSEYHVESYGGYEPEVYKVHDDHGDAVFYQGNGGFYQGNGGFYHDNGGFYHDNGMHHLAFEEYPGEYQGEYGDDGGAFLYH